MNTISIDPGFRRPGLHPGHATTGGAPARPAAGRVAIEIDEGIASETLPAVRGAGAQLFVSASSIFGAADPVAAYAGSRPWRRVSISEAERAALARARELACAAAAA